MKHIWGPNIADMYTSNFHEKLTRESCHKPWSTKSCTRTQIFFLHQNNKQILQRQLLIVFAVSVPVPYIERLWILFTYWNVRYYSESKWKSETMQFKENLDKKKCMSFLLIFNRTTTYVYLIVFYSYFPYAT